jgi:hypothetical protein
MNLLNNRSLEKFILCGNILGILEGVKANYELSKKPLSSEHVNEHIEKMNRLIEILKEEEIEKYERKID